MALKFSPISLGDRTWIYFLIPWVASVVYGGAKLELFAATPGAAPNGASRVAGQRFHLYVFLHPLCGCSTASIDELHRIVEKTHGRLEVTAIIDCAGIRTEEAAPMVRALTGAGGIAVEVDPDGTKTAGFGAKTSGQTLLYNASGTLAFSGGVTAGRAHEGDNAGETAIVEIVGGNVPSTRQSPAFGCALSQPVNRR